jgi:hypothetical protein
MYLELLILAGASERVFQGRDRSRRYFSRGRRKEIARAILRPGGLEPAGADAAHWAGSFWHCTRSHTRYRLRRRIQGRTRSGHCDLLVSPTTAAMNVMVHSWGEANAYWLTRHDMRLLVRERVGRGSPRTVPCAGSAPTVNNVDRIAVRESGPPGSDLVPSSSIFVVDMSHGAFAPGATAEGDGRSEIETDLKLRRAQVWVNAPPGRNHLGFGVRHHELGLNLNRDQDLEVRMQYPYLAQVFAGAGADVIDGRTGSAGILPRRPRLFLLGGGDDRMVGGGARDQLIAGGGADVLVGTHGADQLAGESGPDRLIAGPQYTLLQGGPGNDHLDAHNRRRDWITCGPGDDHARADRREEALGGCEHAPRVHTRF